MATGIVLLWAEIGRAVGNAAGKCKLDVSGMEAHTTEYIAGGILQNLMHDAWQSCQTLAFPG